MMVAADMPDMPELRESVQLPPAARFHISKLEDKYRDVYVLADVEGLPNAEIATLLGLGLPAVKSRLHRARLELRAELNCGAAES